MGWVLVGDIEGDRVGIERGSRSEFPGSGELLAWGWLGGGRGSRAPGTGLPAQQLGRWEPLPDTETLKGL